LKVQCPICLAELDELTLFRAQSDKARELEAQLTAMREDYAQCCKDREALRAKLAKIEDKLYDVLIDE
jgi:hypothetical protein